MAALVAAVPDGVTRLVYLGVHGVERVNQLPYSMQNVFGQLDKLRAAEQEVLLRALKRIPSCSVVRVAQIREEGGDDARCELAPGDALQGAVAASAVEAVLVQSLQRAEAVNASFSVGFASGAALVGPAASIADADVHWDDEFVRLAGPEIYRRPLARAGLDRAVEWVRLWARDFLKDGMRLTTPVELENVDGGVILRFLQPGGVGYDLDFDQEETAEMKYAAAKAASKEGRARSRGTADGALVVVAEAEPYVRVRVTVPRWRGRGCKGDVGADGARASRQGAGSIGQVRSNVPRQRLRPGELWALCREVALGAGYTTRSSAKNESAAPGPGSASFGVSVWWIKITSNSIRLRVGKPVFILIQCT